MLPLDDLIRAPSSPPLKLRTSSAKAIRPRRVVPGSYKNPPALTQTFSFQLRCIFDDQGKFGRLLRGRSFFLLYRMLTLWCKNLRNLAARSPIESIIPLQASLEAEHVDCRRPPTCAWPSQCPVAFLEDRDVKPSSCGSCLNSKLAA